MIEIITGLIGIGLNKLLNGVIFGFSNFISHQYPINYRATE